ncbi:member of major facilitator superfamily multidrug-resistance, DHA1 sub-family [Hysterangium stoloniferum]|nr:member of major facilitator superfamily multidrug-resistance, DHA1 sub-family [Hysterangium stoloniferum]
MEETTRSLGQDSNGNIPVERTISRLPKLQFGVLLCLLLAEAITASLIQPFIVQLVYETGITGGDFNKVGYYAGLVDSIFFVTQALMMLQWGRLSDRIGRRPVLLVGLSGLGLSMFSFGLAQTFWTVVASRALAAALNGNSSIIKCMVYEITDDSNLAQALSLMPIAWSVGSAIGCLVGGTLQHPYERLGGIFRLSEFWKTNPYFLPCISAALYSFSAFALSYFLLKEVLPQTAPSIVKAKSCTSHNPTPHEGCINGDVPPGPINERSPLIPNEQPQSLPLSVLLTPRVRLVILNYSLLALVDIAFIILKPIFLGLPIANGGLGMSSSLIGVYLACSGIVNSLVSILLFSPLTRRFGSRAVLAGCQIAYIACFSLFPIMNGLARVQGGFNAAVWAMLIIQLILSTLPPMAYSSVFMFLTSAAHTRSALGATTGLVQSTTSIIRAIGPAGATSLFAFSIEHNILGGNFIYLVLCALTVGSITTSTFFPRRAWARAD